jgi:hypothetical protein
MNRQVSTRRAWLCTLLCAALVTGSLAPAASAQRRKRKPVVVSFGQPNIWSLEQAHYLLARMHMTNLDLKARELGDNDLDPNAVNGTRINVLKQLIEAGVTFNQGVGFENDLITRNAQFNSNRRLELIADRDRQQSDMTKLMLAHAQLARERAQMNSDPSATQPDKDKKDAEIKENEEEQAAVKSKLDFDASEITSLGAQPSGTPLSPDASATPFDKSRLPDAIIDKLGADKLLDLAKDPKLNASTVLDNHVQMQYEIIAKQLTLLRDEVGPGERLVFLELPQSIYTSPGGGDEKMAQSWWHVNGYTKTDPLVRLLIELLEVELKWQKIQQVKALEPFVKSKARPGTACDVYYATVAAREAATDAKEKWQKNFADWQRKKWEVQRQIDEAVQSAQAQPKQTPTPPPRPQMPDGIEAVTINAANATPIFLETFQEFQCDYESARERLIQQLYREARSDFSRAQQGGARDENQMVEAIRQIIAVTADADAGKHKDGSPSKTVVDAKDTTKEVIKLTTSSQSHVTESNRHAQILKIKDDLLKILSHDDPSDTKDFDEGMKNLLATFQSDFDSDNSAFKRGIEFIRLDEGANGAAVSDVERRRVRAVDIIPRQSSLNVNDLNDTVKAFGLWGSFKFLFGLGGQTSFQRQREQFDQFIHQELYASGFGKGARDFGWTFGALPGTKRVAPGVRTTYAVLVVPADAESVVLSARGCYFPRRDDEPLDYADTADQHWDNTRHNCGDEQTYIIPVPGSDDANFWVTNIDYGAADKGGRVTVSVRGHNFSSQMGVLVNGVPLTPSVGLAQPLLAVAHKGLAPAPCDKRACGELERIDPHEIVFSFTLPKDADGKDVETTPTITLIAPGKSVDLNWLDVTINGTRHTTLGKTPFMFGSRPGDPKLAITDLKVFRVGDKTAPRRAYALLTGTKFDADTEVMINGDPAKAPAPPPPPDKPTCTGAASLPCKELKSENLLRLFFDLPQHGDDVTITLLSKDGKTLATKTFTNPLALKISSVTKISYEPPTDKKSKGVLVVKLTGTGMDARLLLFVNDVLQPSSSILSQSANEVVVRLVTSDPALAVKLMNTETKDAASAVVTREATDTKTQPKQ